MGARERVLMRRLSAVGFRLSGWWSNPMVDAMRRTRLDKLRAGYGHPVLGLGYGLDLGEDFWFWGFWGGVRGIGGIGGCGSRRGCAGHSFNLGAVLGWDELGEGREQA